MYTKDFIHVFNSTSCGLRVLAWHLVTQRLVATIEDTRSAPSLVPIVFREIVLGRAQVVGTLKLMFTSTVK
jgi:hypothetical protein